MGDDAYRVPAASGEAELREKGSRFLAVVAPVGDEAAARAVIDRLAAEHRDATHVCFAWRLGWPPAERAADAGEPHGTAGPPMLRVLQGAGLSDAVAVVVRWFGGVKLGKGGLARAYTGAVRLVLEDLRTVERMPTEEVSLAVPYDRLGAVQRLIDPPRVELASSDYGQTVRLTLRVQRPARAALLEHLAEAGVEERSTTPDDEPREL